MRHLGWFLGLLGAILATRVPDAMGIEIRAHLYSRWATQLSLLAGGPTGPPGPPRSRAHRPGGRTVETTARVGGSGPLAERARRPGVQGDRGRQVHPVGV